jgi:predicted  nucleic acid-binding Zn-ribbon protein
MGPTLLGLIKLQSVENRLRAVKAKLARCRRNVIIQENQIRSLQNALEAKQEEIQLTRVQADRLELELKTRDDSIAKLRTALNTAKTNKEYAAILTELNTNKADNSKIENQILELMKAIEADQTDCLQIKQQIEEQKAKLEQIRKDSETMASKYEAEMVGIQSEWEQASHSIPGEQLSTFKRVAETYDGEALATVEQQDARSDAYTCGGCFMGLTVETVNALMTKDEVIRCPSCSRILVLDTSEK